MDSGDEMQWCQCDGCYNVGPVTVIKLPTTKFYGGKKLSTKYSEKWYCYSCLAKLQRAISGVIEEHLIDIEERKQWVN